MVFNEYGFKTTIVSGLSRHAEADLGNIKTALETTKFQIENNYSRRLFSFSATLRNALRLN
jgi:hypothetical protein